MADRKRIFRDRREAGQLVARGLCRYRGRPDVLVLGLARGGVPVGREVADQLRAPLDVCLVRKLSVPQWPELAMGALTSGDGIVLNENLLRDLGVADSALSAAIERETAELHRREALYRGDRGPLELAGRTVILVDDGIATGASMTAAVRAVRRAGAKEVIVGVPVGPVSVCRRLGEEADEVVCSTMPADFRAVGQVYQDFHQVSDDEVRDLLTA